MVEKDNPFFARTLVNRYWKHFLGRGLVEPEDDLRVTNPASNPELLDALASAPLSAAAAEMLAPAAGGSAIASSSMYGSSSSCASAETDKPPVEVDRALTFAPSGEVVVAALASLRKGGVVAINAIHLDRMPEFDYDRLLWGERQLRSVANMTRADARDFLALAADIGLRPKVTVFSLDQANEALMAVKNDAIDGAAVIVP